MNATTFEFGPWAVACLAHDGARLGELRFNGHDLLTRAPSRFRAPAHDLGRYETRPVYGYDDCFPTVDACSLPSAKAIHIPDHGELCWLSWDVSAGDDRLDCRVHSEMFPGVAFWRRLRFSEDSLSWEFEVTNQGAAALPCLHVMHALLPLDQVVAVRLPEFTTCVDEQRDAELGMGTPAACERFLLDRPTGTAEMLLLRNISRGLVELTLACGLRLAIDFDAQLFPTLGIWWNHAGYPDEDGCRRTECAFEPIPGTCSSLVKSHADGASLTVPPQGSLRWRVTWRVEPV